MAHLRPMGVASRESLINTGSATLPCVACICQMFLYHIPQNIFLSIIYLFIFPFSARKIHAVVSHWTS